MQRFKQHVFWASEERNFDSVHSHSWDASVCFVCSSMFSELRPLLAGAVIHLLLSSALHERKTAACPPLSLCFFHLSFPCGTGQSWEIDRNKLSLHDALPILNYLLYKPSLVSRKAAEADGEAREETERWRDGAGQVEPCKQELIWQLEAAHMANHQHKFEIGNWNLLLCKTRCYTSSIYAHRRLPHAVYT